jgi:hypothetical protein
MNWIETLDLSKIHKDRRISTLQGKNKKLKEKYPDLTTEFESDETGVSKIIFFTRHVNKIVKTDTKKENHNPLLIYDNHKLFNSCSNCGHVDEKWVKESKMRMYLEELVFSQKDTVKELETNIVELKKVSKEQKTGVIPKNIEPEIPPGHTEFSWGL